MTHSHTYPSPIEVEILDQYAMAGQFDAKDVLPEIRRAMVGRGECACWNYGWVVYQRHLDRWQEEPLHMAAAGGYVAHLRALVQAHPHIINALDTEGRTPIHRAAGGCEREAVLALIELGADLDAQDREGMTPLHWAALTLEGEACVDLVRAGANPYVVDKDGETPLDYIYEPELKDEILAAYVSVVADRLDAQTHQASVAPLARVRRL